MAPRDRIRFGQIQQQAEGYLELGMPAHALDALARLGDSANFSVEALYLQGEALRELRRFGEALVPLKQGAELAPEDIRVWLAIGWCEKRVGRVDLAIDAIQRALAVAPGEALLHYNLACYMSILGEKTRVLDHLAKALAIDPNYRDLIDDEPDFDSIRSDPDFRALTSMIA